MLEHASAPPSPCTLCALSAPSWLSTLLKANPVENDGAGTLLGSWRRSYLDAVARTGDQVVEVLHFMGGEDSPRRVLCPWRAHRLATHRGILFGAGLGPSDDSLHGLSSTHTSRSTRPSLEQRPAR